MERTRLATADLEAASLAHGEYASALKPRNADPVDETWPPPGYESTDMRRRQPGATPSRRFVIQDMEIRRGGPGPGIISGYAAVFGQRSQPMPGNGGSPFVEMLAPTAFTRALSAGCDLKMLWDHDTSGILGRRKSGTLRVNEDRAGLGFSCDLPPTQLGEEAAATIARGDVDGCSFGFRKVKDTWSTDEDGMRLRTLQEVVPFELSCTGWPCYEGTSVSLASAGGVRSLNDCRRQLLGHLENMVGIRPNDARRRQLENRELLDHRRRILRLMEL